MPVEPAAALYANGGSLSMCRCRGCRKWSLLAAVVALLISLNASSRLAASVGTAGSVTPVPPSGGGTFTNAWLVGEQITSGSDPRGWAKIDGGTALQYGTLIVGDQAGFTGQLSVVGDFANGLNSK